MTRTLDSEALRMSVAYPQREARIVPLRISAIPIVAAEDGKRRLGTITQLPQGAELEISGEGFNDRTVKVRWHNSFYFVFRDDIEIVASKN